MIDMWDDKEAAKCNNELELRVYSSRLLGSDPNLVLHGGGNTSVKITEQNIYGKEEEILYIKGSGWDLATIEPEGFSPVRLEAVRSLANLKSLTDPQMVNELKTSLTNASAPSPSVETILHAIIPFQYVDHTHADVIVSITNTENGSEYMKEIYGDEVIYLPYVMPGFDLAKLAAIEWRKQLNPSTIGMVLMNHGIFSFGDTAKESYRNMLFLINKAEQFLHQKAALPQKKAPDNHIVPSVSTETIAKIRKEISVKAGFSAILRSDYNIKALHFANLPNVEEISQRGPATPDHIIRTKRTPALKRDVESFSRAYVDYFNKYSREIAKEGKESKTMLDPAPRVLLDRELGVMGVGKSVKDAMIVTELYDHTIDVIMAAQKLGGYQAVNAKDLFELEYWSLEQAKLAKKGSAPPLQGKIALVTGAARGIGKAIVERFLSEGAVVIGLDLDEGVETLQKSNNPAYMPVRCNITDIDAIETALRKCALQYGGLDIVVLNAGVFPSSQAIADMDMESWNKTMEINLNSNTAILKTAYPMLRHSPGGGNVVMIGSKNVPAPGPGASAYSASKAALFQLSRVAALEWGKDGIRVNTIHPNAVFDTGIWTEEVLESRAKSYGMSVEEYKTNNLLKTEITSHDVAQLALTLCTAPFSKTTGAAIPIDGGNERVI